MAGDVRVLDIMYYMTCPPNSGGLLRILGPLYKMDPGDGISFDILFSTFDDGYAERNVRALKEIPVVDEAVGVTVRDYLKSEVPVPDGISESVWVTMAPELRDRAVSMVERKHYDIIQIEHSQLSWIVPYLRLASPRSKFVLDCHNIENSVYKRWVDYARVDERAALERKYEQLRAWEQKVWPWYDAAFSVSSVEAGTLRGSGIRRVYTVPTGGGIDPEKYARNENADRPYDLMYIGTMNWYPNAQGLLWFIREVYPLILEKRPGTNMRIIGSGKPEPELVDACRSSDIRFMGFQKDDVGFFHGSKVFLVPLWIGAGARVKIVTAWASKVPVVATTVGAEGLDAKDGENIFLADEPREFAEKVLRLLDDGDLRDSIAERAYATFRKEYTVEECVRKLVSAYREIASGRP